MRPRGDLPLPHGHGERLERDVLIGLATHGQPMTRREYKSRSTAR